MSSRWLAALLLASACQEYTVGTPNDDPPIPPDDLDPGWGACDFRWEPRPIDPTEGCTAYDIGEFNPWIEWEHGAGRSMRSIPAVADLDLDGIPEVIANYTDLGPTSPGQLVVIRGDGSGVVWRDNNARLGAAASPAVGDIDLDGSPEVVVVKHVRGPGLPIGGQDRYAVVAYTADGRKLWQSAEFRKLDFDYSASVALADLDGDGRVEIVAGRVILDADGELVGKGAHGSGSWGRVPDVVTGGEGSEGAFPAIADLDLDGVQEIVVGDAIYGPRGETLWHDGGRTDGMVAIANLDDDPEGEFVVASYDTVRAHDTDGTRLWGPKPLDGANIVSPPAIADLDGDGDVEIVVAGGNEVRALHHDGTLHWSRGVTDESGFTGASIFDFEADGKPEVVYIDEVAMYAFDGATGDLRFYSDEHGSDTMGDYPVVADVDGDGSAEILVAHANFGVALTVYGAGDGRWAPTRGLWNQHAYQIDNVMDDLSVAPASGQGFATHNTWHAALPADDDEPDVWYDLQSEILDVCELQCGLGRLWVAARPSNLTEAEAIPAGLPLSLYAVLGDRRELVETRLTEAPIRGGWSGDPMVFQVPADLAQVADALEVVVDDDGKGRGAWPECAEEDNVWVVEGPFCQ